MSFRLTRGFVTRAVAVGAVSMSSVIAGVILVEPGLATARSARSVPRTVLVGSTPVAVSSAGTVTVDGQTVSVMPGAKRVVVIAPPAGSTNLPGSQGAMLPAGATAMRISYAPPAAGVTVVPSTAVFGNPTGQTASAPSSPDEGYPECNLTAHEPSQLGGVRQVQGVSSVTGEYCTDEIEQELTSTLYTAPSSGSPAGQTTKRGHHTEYFDGTGESTVQTACPAKNLYWHTRADLETEDTDTGVEYEGYTNSDPKFIPCP